MKTIIYKCALYTDKCTDYKIYYDEMLIKRINETASQGKEYLTPIY